MGEQTDGQPEVVPEPVEEAAPEVVKRTLTRADLAEVKQRPRSLLRRKLIDVPEFGEGAQVWCFGIDAIDRQLADEYAAPGGKRNMILYQEAMVARSLRESDADDAKPLFDVPGPDNGKLPAMGWTFLTKLFNETMMIDLGEDLGQKVMAALQDFGKAEETPS